MMPEWIREWWMSLPDWGRALAVLALVGLVAYLVTIGIDMSPIWRLLGVE